MERFCWLEPYKIINLNIMNKIKEEYVINESVITLSRVFKYLNEEWFEKSNPKKASEQKEERKESGPLELIYKRRQ